MAYEVPTLTLVGAAQSLVLAASPDFEKDTQVCAEPDPIVEPQQEYDPRELW